MHIVHVPYLFRHSNGNTYRPADPAAYPEHADEINDAIAKHEADPAWTKVHDATVNPGFRCNTCGDGIDYCRCPDY